MSSIGVGGIAVVSIRSIHSGVGGIVQHGVVNNGGSEGGEDGGGSRVNGGNNRGGNLVDGGGSLLGGQSSALNVSKVGEEVGLGSGYVLNVVQVGVGNLRGLQIFFNVKQVVSVFSFYHVC